jgi:hypothetical protein
MGHRPPTPRVVGQAPGRCAPDAGAVNTLVFKFGTFDGLAQMAIGRAGPSARSANGRRTFLTTSVQSGSTCRRLGLEHTAPQRHRTSKRLYARMRAKLSYS